MATIVSNREARRRRILEQGSQRLAFITGSIQSLPQADCYRHEHVRIDSSLPTQDSGREASVLNKSVKTLLHNHDKHNNATRTTTLLGVEEESSSIQSPLLDHQHERLTRPNLPTMGQISSAVVASENIRMRCSVAAAIFVILSSTEVPIPGWWHVRGSILFRPLYLLLLTNVTIVLARIILRSQDPKSSRMVRIMTSNVPATGGNGLFDLVGKALEAGLLMKKVIEALSFDFSVYALVLICGLSLVRLLGW